MSVESHAKPEPVDYRLASFEIFPLLASNFIIEVVKKDTAIANLWETQGHIKVTSRSRQNQIGVMFRDNQRCIDRCSCLLSFGHRRKNVESANYSQPESGLKWLRKIAALWKLSEANASHHVEANLITLLCIDKRAVNWRFHWNASFEAFEALSCEVCQWWNSSLC